MNTCADCRPARRAMVRDPIGGLPMSGVAVVTDYVTTPPAPAAGIGIVFHVLRDKLAEAFLRFPATP